LDLNEVPDPLKTRPPPEWFNEVYRLLTAGLDAEPNDRLSEHALSATPDCFPNIRLHPHQLHAIEKILYILENVDPPSALLMGLGKSYILHALMQALRSTGRPGLLILPAALMDMWELILPLARQRKPQITRYFTT
jgi:hypothetical protein